VTQLALAALAIFAINLLPAFAPPTWTVLVYFSLSFDLPAVPLIVIGVICASSGRWLLAHAFRKLRPRLHRGYVRNMENLGSQVTKNSRRTGAAIGLFFLSPLSSAQLFVAAGLMPRVKLLPLTFAFAAGRLFTYTGYVTGSQAFLSTDLGAVVRSEITSPIAIAIQVTFVVALIGLGLVKWPEHQPAGLAE